MKHQKVSTNKNGAVHITSLKPEFNGSYFGLPSSSIHRMTWPAGNFLYSTLAKKKEPSWWCIMWYRRICGLISLQCIDAWSCGSRKSRSLAVPQLNQAPWFLDITRFWFYASTAWFFFLSRVELWHMRTGSITGETAHAHVRWPSLHLSNRQLTRGLRRERSLWRALRNPSFSSWQEKKNTKKKTRIQWHNLVSRKFYRKAYKNSLGLDWQ